MLSEDQKRILGYFIEEAKDHLNTIEQGLLNLQTTIEDAEMVNEVFRAAHSVKGGAAMLGLNSIQRTSHRLEDFFKLMKESPPQADRELETMLLRIFDGLQEQLDQLQSPYGLSDEQARDILSGLEPVFAETENHLQTLLDQAPAPPKATPTPSPKTTSAPAAPHPETSALQLVFQSDVPALLRDMLATFKKSDTEATRQDLVQICQRFNSVGVQFELSQWSDLVKVTEATITNPGQSFRALAPVIIKNLKQAQDLVLQGHSEQISPSEELMALVPSKSLVEEPDDSTLDDLLADALDSEGTDESDLSDLFAAAESEEPQRALELDERWLDLVTQTSTSDVEDLEAAFDSLTAEVLESNPQEPRDGNAEVEVGKEELNSLADLFEGDMAGFEAAWEEEVTDERPSPQAEQDNSSNLDSDLDDLLGSSEPVETDAGTADDDFASLFGTTLDGSTDESSDHFDPASAPPNAAQDSSLMDDLEDDQLTFTESSEESGGSNLDNFFAIEDGDNTYTSTDIPSSPSGFDDFFDAAAASAAADGEPDLLVDDDLFTANSQAGAAEESTLAGAVPTAQPPDSPHVPSAASPDNDLDELFSAPAVSSDASDLAVDGESTDPVACDDLDLDLDELSSPLDNCSEPPQPDQFSLEIPDASTQEVSEAAPNPWDDDAQITDAFDQTINAVPEDGSASDDLDVLLDDSEPSNPIVDTEPEGAPDGSGLDDLDALFDGPEPSASIADPAPEEVSDDSFEDLESLLDDDSARSATAEPAQPQDNEPVTAPAQNSEDLDEFSDLEKLLEDTDQLGGSSPTLSARRGGATQATRRPPRRTAAVTDQTMRVSVNHLDILSNLVGELVVNRNSLEQDQDRLRQFLDNLLAQVQQLNDVGQRMRDLYERSLLESSLISSRQAMTSGGSANGGGSHATGATFDALEMDRFTGFHTLSQEMIELIVRVREAASDIEFTVDSSDQITRQFRQVTTQLQEGLNKARMVPFGQTADRLPRAVRDISLKCGKEARLVVEGRDTLIDKMILERLYDPVTHLVNNAITHGIEPPVEREANGKPREGSITIRAFYQGNQTVIYIADDGGGINPEVVKAKALKRGLITNAEAQDMSEVEVYDLLFLPGFSTRDKADDFSGRGVGMDVVRTALAEIRGAITIESTLGKGTSFTIRLPLTLSITKALSCVNNQARIAFPMDGVEDMFDVPRERIQTNDQGVSCILWRDTLLPFRPLSDLLQFNRGLGRGRVYGGTADDNVISIVVLRSASTFIGLQVDQVIGEQEIVIKQLEGPVPKPTGIAGATVMGDGRVMPIADVLELIDLATGRVRREPTTSLWGQGEEEDTTSTVDRDEPTVLIVDDSITVRELLSMSFNKVGYHVEQARDGQEAWEKLRSGLPCNLVFCDIEMPRMDGLELLSRLQQDQQLSQIPIAMLTSRGADRHRQMAVELGASGYFTKPYLEEMLLDAAQRMLNGENMMGAGAESQPQEA